MKQAILLSAMGALASFATVAGAQEVGRVISSTPVIQQVAVPRQVCSAQPVAVQQPSSGGGAVVGAIVGGLLGNTIGHGMGRAAATGVGIVAGAAVGDNIEGRGNYAQAAPLCSTQTYYENRTVGYNVQYEYAGKQYNVQLPVRPGPDHPPAGHPCRRGQPGAGHRGRAPRQPRQWRCAGDRGAARSHRRPAGGAGRRRAFDDGVPGRIQPHVLRARLRTVLRALLRRPRLLSADRPFARLQLLGRAPSRRHRHWR